MPIPHVTFLFGQPLPATPNLRPSRGAGTIAGFLLTQSFGWALHNGNGWRTPQAGPGFCAINPSLSKGWDALIAPDLSVLFAHTGPDGVRLAPFVAKSRSHCIPFQEKSRWLAFVNACERNPVAPHPPGFCRIDQATPEDVDRLSRWCLALSLMDATTRGVGWTDPNTHVRFGVLGARITGLGTLVPGQLVVLNTITPDRSSLAKGKALLTRIHVPVRQGPGPIGQTVRLVVGDALASPAPWSAHDALALGRALH